MKAHTPMLSVRWHWAAVGLIALWFYCFIWRDPMVQLSIELSRNPMFLTGFCGSIDAPITATPEDILQPYLSTVSSNRGPFSPFRIERTGRVFVCDLLWGPPDIYPAALIDSPSGKVIVLYRYTSDKPDISHPNATGSWWTKVYDLPN